MELPAFQNSTAGRMLRVPGQEYGLPSCSAAACFDVDGGVDRVPLLCLIHRWLTEFEEGKSR